MGTLTSGRVADQDRRLTCVEDCRRLAITEWLAGDRPPGLDAVALADSRPGFGGRRRWFACPGCGRRCGVLYRPLAAERWGCRACLRLTYRARQQKDADRTYRAGLAWWAFWPGSIHDGLAVCPDWAGLAMGRTLLAEDEKALALAGRTPVDLAEEAAGR